MWLGMLAGGGRPAARGSRSSRSPGSPGCSPPTSPRSPPGSRPRRGPRSSSPIGGVPCLVARLRRARAWAPALALAWARRRRAPAARAARLRLAAGAARWSRSRLRRPLPAAPSVGAAPGSRSLTATVLDVGQGDAILLEPAAGEPVLIDAGPPDAGVAAQLAERGVDRLAALVLTHPDADHSGGAAGAARLDRGRPPRLRAGAGAAARARPGRSAPRVERLAAGATPALRAACGCGCSGRRRGWRARRGRGEEPNLLSLVVARPLPRLSHAAHRRRGGRARAGPSGRRRRAQGRPPRQRGRRPRRRCSPRLSRSSP